jgi:phosphoribosylformylglycinamidine cyclo-ligase
MAKVSYSSSGVNYENLDKIKRLAQTSALQTSKNLESSGFKALDSSRGETAFVWDEGDLYKALVIESLGTKSTIAEEVLQKTGKSFFEEIAQDTVAMIVNDLIVVGAKPLVVNAYFGLGNSDWLLENSKGEDLIKGFAAACDLSGAVWGGGETPSLSGIVNENSIDLAGSAVGIINPKDRLTLGDKIKSDDAIIFIESNGMHANGISLVRKIAEELPQRYETKLPSGQTLVESVLRPTHIYAKAIQSLFDQGINIHYLSNITGHGFRKIMRAKENFTYNIEDLPEVDELFKFIQEESGMSDEDMYGTFNMGVGFAIMLPKDQAQKAVEIIKENGFKSWVGGKVETGEKQVIIKPLNIIFKSESLNIR